ncbi:MAG: hypothetical protein RI947_1370 [Candidatus Parcubacteria bacterium]|jgi:hypothetical protein
MTNMVWTRKNGLRLAGIGILTATLITMIIYVAPDNIFIVGAFITLFSLFASLVASLFVTPLLYTFIAGLAMFLFLSMCYFTGFQILNTILLICFIIGLSIVVKK